MWLNARNNEQQLQAQERQQVILELQTTLASSAVDARSGHYEPARQQVSDFYTRLGQELKKGEDSAFGPNQREKMIILMSQRDDLITLLARSDPASVDRLFGLFRAYETAVAPSATNKTAVADTSSAPSAVGASEP